MFFPEKIISINDTDKVLEVGPGGTPFHRSDVLLEKLFDDDEAHAQRGYADKLVTGKQIIYYSGGEFPFADNEFDYVVCSHVLEHVPEMDLELFIRELTRVARKGYVEFPTAYYEVINYQDVHLWLMNYINGEILFLNKKIIHSTFIDKTLRKLFYSNPEMSSIFLKYKELFFIGFEWKTELKYKVIDSLEELNDNKMVEWEKYFSRPLETKQPLSFFYRLKRKIFYLLNRIPRKKEKAKISKTAILEKKSLIKIGVNAEIQDYVIIKTYDKEVTIGKNTQLNPYTVIYGGNGVIIGDNVMIAPHCTIVSGNHDFIQVDKPMRWAGTVYAGGPVTIEDDVWIGANCTITDGVRIGHGAVVGANSVVTKDVCAYDIVAGSPAKVIKNRLNDR